MDLRELVAAVDGIEIQLDAPADPLVELTTVVHDTADVVPGALFCCVRGSTRDGHDFAADAVARGAAALLVDHPLEVEAAQLVVDDVRTAMGPIAAAFWGHPAKRLAVLGVTGTAGKTTVTHLLRSILVTAGWPAGLIGTLSGARTTPDAPEFQAMLARNVADGKRAIAVEVSSHGLELHRVDGTWFEVAVFTNLSPEHLDFHPTMEAYFAAKARLFTPAFTKRAVICVEDTWGRRLFDEVQADGDVEALPYSLADASDVQLSATGATFGWLGHRVELPHPGSFNVLNALAAATTAHSLGIDPAVIAKGLGESEPVPGRFEPVRAGQPFSVLVDYSHKPDALEQALRAARELSPEGRLVVVFGCGGDRDPTKRPLMGTVAARLADDVIVTSDNPRSEDPLAIIDEIVAGLPRPSGGEREVPDNVRVEPDRRAAINLAIHHAAAGDVVLLAGKGHETTQTIGDKSLPFDDRVVAREALAASGFAGQGADA